jgi:hypothetical protein
MSSALPPASAAADISADAQTKIDHIVAMGFNRAEVETCMRAVSNDIDTAIEFLLGGIPASGMRTHVASAAPASSTSPSTEHIFTKDLARKFSVIGSTAGAYRELLQLIESSDPAITKLRLEGTALAPWKGEASDVECSDFRVTFHRFSTVRGAEFHRCESQAYYEIVVKQTCPCPQFGFCTSDFQTQLSGSNEGCGDDLHSWGWDGSRRLFWCGAKKSIPEVNWKSGDCLGFEIDFTSNATKLSINGVLVHKHEFSSSTHTLYACMSAQNCEIYVNFGWNVRGKSFLFPPNWAGPSAAVLCSRELDYGILSRALSLNTCITSLNLSNTAIDPAVSSLLFSSLTHLSAMTYLNLGNTSLESSGAWHLCSAFAHLTALTALQLSSNQLTADDAARICAAAAAAGITSLTTLDMHSNPSRDRPFSSWDVVRCKAWNEFNLPHVSDDCFLKIADSTALYQYIMSRDRHGLIVQYYSTFRFPGLSVELLQRIERSDPELACLAINDWGRHPVELHATGFTVLARALSSNTCITSLDLFKASIGSECVSIFSAISQLTALTFLGLTYNQLTADDGARICAAAAAAGMTSLKELDLGRNGFDAWSVVKCEAWRQLKLPQPPDEIVLACKTIWSKIWRQNPENFRNPYVMDADKCNVEPIVSYLASEDKVPSHAIRMFVIGESTVHPPLPLLMIVSAVFIELFCTPIL